MKITKVRLTRSKVSVEYENEGDTFAVVSHDRPLPSFYEAVAALCPIILSILHLPATYAGTPNPKDLATTLHPLKPTGLTISEKQDVRLVCLTAHKELPDSHSPFNIATPLRFLEHPQEEGSYSPALTAEQVAAIDAVIAEAKKYVGGARAQGVLPLETPEDTEKEAAAEPQSGDVLDFPNTGDAGHEEGEDDADEAPAKKPRKKAK